MSDFRIPRAGHLATPFKWLVRPVVRRLRDAFLQPALAQIREGQERTAAQLRDIQDAMRMTDCMLFGLALAARPTRRADIRPRRLYVDMRCLQTPPYTFRGIGYHTAGILRHARRFLGADFPTVGLLDADLSDLAPQYAALVDRTTANLTPEEGPALVLHPAPMSYDGSWLAPMFNRPDIAHAAIFYDAIPLEEPDRYLPSALAYRCYMNNLAWLRAADLLFPISETSASRLRELIDCPDEKLSVTGACLRDAFTRPDSGGDSSRPFPERGYFLMVGGDDARKNVEVVLEAHAGLNSAVGLVVAGHYDDDHTAQLRERHRRAGGEPARLHFARGLSDPQLAEFYRGALATVVPSRNEGFSLPVAESLACGCPVLVSNIAAHRELVTAPESFFPPGDRAEIARKLGGIAADPEMRAVLLRRQTAESKSNAESDVSARVWSRIVERFPPAKQCGMPTAG